MKRKVKIGKGHSCHLIATSNENVSQQIDGKKGHQLKNLFLKLTLISEKNARARIFFRSNASIYFEKRRHIHSEYLYIIHPFSTFRLIWEAFMIIIFVLSLVLLPFNVARNMEHMETGAHLTPTHGVLLFCDLICMMDVLIRCLTGYENSYTKEVYLDPKHIFRIYFGNGGFLVDFFTSTPYQLLRYSSISDTKKIYTFLLSLLKVVRSRTLFKYARQLLVNWQINTILFKLVIYIGMSFFILHWAACLFIIIPKIIYMVDPTIETWIDAENLRPNSTEVQYRFSIYMATAAFLCIKYSEEDFRNIFDVAMVAVVVLVGYIMCIYVFGKSASHNLGFTGLCLLLMLVVIILQMVLSSNTPATKYQSIMSQLYQYMRHRQLPIALQHRLVQYYTHRFRKTYFRESAIMPILSDRLQTEINLHCYTTLVENVTILQDLPDNIVSDIVSHLRSEIYLPNDIIIKAGTVGDCMYFIATGTVAVSTPTGREVCHLQDGAYFGEIALIRKDSKRIANVIAIEICEVYKLESKVFKKCLVGQPETYKRLEKISQDRFNRTNFLEELHKKHMLERSLARKHEMD